MINIPRQLLCRSSRFALALVASSPLAAKGQTVWNVNFHNQIATTENFVGAAPENTTNSTWNRIGGATNSLPVVGRALADSTGSTAAAVSIDLSVIKNGSTQTNTGNQTLTANGALKIFNGWIGTELTTSTLVINGLNPLNTYDMVVYSDWWWRNGDSLPVSQTLGTGLASRIFINRVLGTNNTFIPLTQDTNPADVTSGAGNTGNWYRITGLVPDSNGKLGFSIGAYGTTAGQRGNTAFNGFQLIENGAGAVDTTPPTPSPMTWASPPSALGISSISMTATTASDGSGVEYHFEETSGNPGGSDSGWQDSPTYIDDGLNPATSYTYMVTARDKSAARNETLASAPASATTTASPQTTNVWNLQIASQAGNQITTSENFVGAASENTPNSTWNRVASLPQNGMYLKNSLGLDTDVTFHFTSSNNIGTQNLTSGSKIFNSYIGGLGATSNMTIKGLSIASSYDIVIYSDWWWGGDPYPVRQTIGSGLAGTIYLNRIPKSTNGVVPALTEDTNPANVTSGSGNIGNWYRIENLSPSPEGELGFLLGDGANAPFNGFQLVESPLPPRADILTFGLPGNPATINGTNITLTLPYGSALSNLAPQFTLWPGASANPASGTVRNFSTPQSYTVTSSDSLVSQIYTVTAVVAPPLPEFNLSAPATWDGRSTMIVEPQISNLALLQATGGTNFTYQWNTEGVAVTQESGTGTLSLTRSQGSGLLQVALTLGNGTTGVTRMATIRVLEPASDPWTERTPLANEKPVNGQFFARNPFTNFGTIFYRGSQVGTPDEVYLKVYKTPNGGEEVLDSVQRQTLAEGTYAFAVQVAAGLTTYRVVYGTTSGGVDSDIHTVTDLICGDAFIIEGQSNAVATDNSAPRDDSTSPWIRTYGRAGGAWGRARSKAPDPSWEMNIGFWGMELARRIVADHQMPVCFINGAIGGTRIDEHLANPADPTVAGTQHAIYANLLNRVIGARLTHGIRGIFWHQGESDYSNFGPISDYDYTAYQKNFLTLSSSWKRDYPNFQRYIIYQVMPKACSIGPKGDQLREVQRNLPRLFSRMSILNTLGIAGYEGCHFSRVGYEGIATRMVPLVSRDFYGAQGGASVSAPNLRRAYFANANRTSITLEFDQEMGWSSFSVSNYYLDDVGGRVVGGSASGNKITLQLASAAAADTSIDYLKDDFWSANEKVSTLLYGSNGIPALTFADVPVEAKAPFEAWIDSKNLEGMDAAPDGDPDGDGLKNALEHVLGGEPNPASPGSNSTSRLPSSWRDQDGDLVFAFQRKVESIEAVDLRFQWSADLDFTETNSVRIGPTASSEGGVTVAVSGIDAATDLVSVTVPAGRAVDGTLFARLQARIP